MTTILTENEEIRIRVSVSGNSGSGRTALTHRLDQFIYKRPQDGKIFKITAEERELESPLFPHFDCSISTFTLDDSKLFEIRERWMPFKTLISDKYPDYRSRICFVGTKVDLVVPDPRPHVLLRCLPSSIAFLAQVEFRSVSSVTGAGLDEIVSMIANCKAPLRDVERPRAQPTFVQLLKDKALDIIASWFALPVPADINNDTRDPIEIANDDVVDIMHQAPESMAYNSEYAHKFGGTMKSWPAYLIYPTLIAIPRMWRPTAWGNAVFARSHLRIPIPQPRYPHLDYWLVSEYVPGKLLMGCWDSLSLFMKFRIACTLRGYIGQMRLLTRRMPGSALGGHVIGHIFVPQTIYNGPFESVERFNQFVKCATYQGWAKDIIQRMSYNRQCSHKEPVPLPPEPEIPEGDDDVLVFTHADINLANLILTDDGILWMIDWDDSGFYPPWVEKVAMYEYRNAPKSWQRLLWFIVGPLPVHQPTLWEYFFSAAEDFGTPYPRLAFC